MTTKHFAALAATIADSPALRRPETISALANFCKEQNPRFQLPAFVAAIVAAGGGKIDKDWHTRQTAALAANAAKGESQVKIPASFRQAWKESDDGDKWGNCQQWRFTLADALTTKGHRPAQFRPSPSGPETDWSYFMVLRYSTATLKHLWAVLERLANIHRAAGRDY
jgi:hypothetical protein